MSNAKTGDSDDPRGQEHVHGHSLVHSMHAATGAAGHPSNVPGGKLGLLLSTLAQDGGATIDVLTVLTGWLPHTTRAAMTRLRQRGHAIVLRKHGEQKTYQIAQPAMAAAAEAVDGPR